MYLTASALSLDAPIRLVRNLRPLPKILALSPPSAMVITGALSPEGQGCQTLVFGLEEKKGELITGEP